MANYEHDKIVDEIRRIDELPPDQEGFERWLKAERHLNFLRLNACSDEVVIYASGEYSFVHATVISNKRLKTLNEDDLLHFRESRNPFTSIASYVHGGGRDDVWVERFDALDDSTKLDVATQLVFARTFEGWSGPGQTYFEVSQEYAHITGIHWRPEYRAYCRFDENGDLENVVSVTTRHDGKKDVACVSFAWRPLEEYLVATDSTLLRRFDFTLLRRGSFGGWPAGPESVCRESEQLVYRKKTVPGVAAYTTGTQLVAPRRTYAVVYDQLRGKQFDQLYVELISWDWRNKCVAEISTDPEATTNYFEAHTNSLPFELSPAFFKPEVILKYKTDKDKYTVGEREITCRSAWHLEAFDVNEAGQVFAYICYLRNLPYSEQLHWKSFNEKPKAGISQRAITNDFEGEWTNYRDPLQEILMILKSWTDNGVPWWKLRDERLPVRISTPLTASRDEWAEAFMDLAKLIVEGFVISEIRAVLDRLGIAYEDSDKSIVLLERLLTGDLDSAEKQTLAGLRTTQQVRTKVKGHASGREAETLVQAVIAEDGSFANHFKRVCATVALELQNITRAFA